MIRGLTARQLAGEVFLRSRRKVSRSISRALDDRQATYVSDEALRRSLGDSSVADIAVRIHQHRGMHITPGLGDLARTASIVKDLFPDSIEQSRLEAEAILAHQIPLFGRTHDLGPHIDWHLDPISSARWPLEHYTRTPLVIGQGADVRVVWELNRLQHFTALGRAYALTGDERYTEEFLIQLASWHEANPPRFGVNWTVAMEAAIRAVNIIAALELFGQSPQLTDEAVKLILKMLIAHGRFIRANLEFSYRAASNHYLSDLIGLFAIGMTMPELRESPGWVSYSAGRLLEEMDRQVLADGVDYEGAIGYHRLALEIFTLFFSISHAAGVEIPGRFWERLEAMFDFVRHYLKPDGTAPAVGDSDDGRLIKFKPRPAGDHSYLMSIAAVLIESETFKQSGRIDEEAIWWFGEEGREAFDSLANGERPDSRAFPEAQMFIQRGHGRQDARVPIEKEDDGPLYAIIDCGDHGLRGRGSHAHSDALSIEVFAQGRTFLRDPGTFAYTASERWRNRFRSTAYHNTVRVDGEEISETNEGELFVFASNVRPRVNGWESNSERDVLDAEHYAYQRLAQPVTHRRIITLDKREGHWIIEDIFTGEGRHRFEFFFNFDAGLDTRIEADASAVVFDRRSALAIAPASGHAFETKLTERWVSPDYGTRISSSGIIFQLNAEVPFKNIMLLIPFRLGDEEKIEKVRGQFSALS